MTDDRMNGFVERTDAIHEELTGFLKGHFDRTDMPTSEAVEEYLTVVYATLQFHASLYFTILGRSQKTFLDLAKKSLHAAEDEHNRRMRRMEASHADQE